MGLVGRFLGGFGDGLDCFKWDGMTLFFVVASDDEAGCQGSAGRAAERPIVGGRSGLQWSGCLVGDSSSGLLPAQTARPRGFSVPVLRTKAPRCPLLTTGEEAY